MTVNTVIAQTDSERPSLFSREQKLCFLSEFELGAVYEILSRYENFDKKYPPITADTPGDRILALPDEYAHLYRLWLFVRMSYASADAQAYENDERCYNEALDGVKRSLRARFLPKGERKLTLGGEAL